MSMSLSQLAQRIFKDMFEKETFDLSLVQKYFHPEYIQHVDGKTINYDQFIQHIQALKAAVKQVKIVFEQLVTEGQTVCSNHYAHVTKADGSQSKTKVIAFLTFKDNQLIRCDELTHLLQGDAEDKDLGSRL